MLGRRVRTGKSSTHSSRQFNNLRFVTTSQLGDYVEAEEVANDHAPVRACVRYLHNRPHHLDYKGALEKGLPIGSGEIESAHRYVIQQRLKLPGAWWKADNVEPMLALRVVRANEDWAKYWENLAAAA